MKFLTAIFIFCVVLFLYLHIYYHLKVSNDLEIYTIERPSKDKLEEICDLRQPVAFEFHSDRVTSRCSIEALEEEYGAFDVKIRDAEDHGNEDGLYVPLLLKEAFHLFRTDPAHRFMTENNSDFLAETGLTKTLRHEDCFLRPPMVSRCMYDLFSGSAGCSTPLRYSLCYRNFLYLTGGSARVKLIPPRSSRYLYTVKDYDNFEYRSPVNPWVVQPQYRGDMDKVKSLDLELSAGTVVYIPAYWWYSISYDKVSTIVNFQYRTYMNTLAILPELFLCFLQKQNVKIESVEKVPAREAEPAAGKANGQGESSAPTNGQGPQRTTAPVRSAIPIPPPSAAGGDPAGVGDGGFGDAVSAAAPFEVSAASSS